MCYSFGDIFHAYFHLIQYKTILEYANMDVEVAKINHSVVNWIGCTKIKVATESSIYVTTNSVCLKLPITRPLIAIGIG